MLAICGGYQMLGQYYINAAGNKIDCTGILPHYTKNLGNDRFIGDIQIHNEEFGETYYGFENHSGITYLGEGEKLWVKWFMVAGTIPTMTPKGSTIKIHLVLTSTVPSFRAMHAWPIVSSQLPCIKNTGKTWNFQPSRKFSPTKKKDNKSRMPNVKLNITNIKLKTVE